MENILSGTLAKNVTIQSEISRTFKLLDSIEDKITFTCPQAETCSSQDNKLSSKLDDVIRINQRLESIDKILEIL